MRMVSSYAPHVALMAAKQSNPGHLDHLEGKRETRKNYKESALTFVWIVLTSMFTTVFTAVSTTVWTSVLRLYGMSAGLHL
jgi:hypothetical protein